MSLAVQSQNFTLPASSSLASYQAFSSPAPIADNSIIFIEPKSPAYVFGKYVIKPLINTARVATSNVRSYWKWSVSSTDDAEEIRLARNSASSCYKDIIAKYPDISGGTKVLIQNICDNASPSLDVDVNITLSTMQAISDALVQNTSITSVTFDQAGSFENEVEGITALVNALKVNRIIRELDIECVLSNEATQIFFENLHCFNLTKLNISGGDISLTGAQALQKFLEKDSFPLTALYLVPGVGEISSNTFATISEALSKNHCVTTYSGYLDATLFGQMNNSSSIAYLGGFFGVQAGPVIDAIVADTCFLGFKNAPYLPTGITEDEVKELVKDRTPCPQKPQCKIFQKEQVCKTSTSNPGSSNSTIIGAIIGVLGGVSIITGFIIFLFRKFKRRQGYEEQV